MITRLPKWVEYGAFTLALLAGAVNVVGIMGFQHQLVSHLSGTATLLGIELFSLSSDVFHFVATLLSFMVGSAISGYFISSASLRLGRHYDSLLVIEGFFLLMAIYLMEQHTVYGQYFSSAACGLQSALATTYSGAVIRTTHLTGIFTDLGIMFGSALRGEPFDKRKCILLGGNSENGKGKFGR
jgi:uncharacterized membrane protein YoaK (UPF0700 family)